MSLATTTTLDRALDAAVARLLALQRPGGWWVGELESNVTMTAQHLFFLEFLRIRDYETTLRCANELLARQREDGTWAIYWGGEPNLDATIEAYTALRLAGLDADDPRLAGARRFAEEGGGIGAARVFTRIWLALFGLWPWDEIQVIPPELILLPPGSPLSVYAFACWARQTVVPLTIVMHYRPVRRLPEERLARELDLGLAPIDLGRPARRVHLRHEHLRDGQAELAAALAHMIADRRLGDVGAVLVDQPPPDPPRRVPLLPRRAPIGLQDRVDEPDDRLQPRPGSWRRRLLARLRVVQCLTHQPSVHAELPRHPLDRPDPELILPPDLLEQLHPRPRSHPPTVEPLHGRPRPARRGGEPLCLSSRGRRGWTG